MACQVAQQRLVDHGLQLLMMKPRQTLFAVSWKVEADSEGGDGDVFVAVMALEVAHAEATVAESAAGMQATPSATEHADHVE